MIITEIQSDIQTIESDAKLFDEINFDSRANAIDFIEFHIIDRIDSLMKQSTIIEELQPLKQQAENLKKRLEQIDNNLFIKLREKIRAGACNGAAVRTMIDTYTKSDTNNGEQPGYDNLDVFINGLFAVHTIPQPVNKLEPEMVFYQKTPARVILELTQMARLKPGDVFFDIGSGLGQVPLLVNLVSGAAAKGVEFETAYHEYAVNCAAKLNLPNVEFINADAREVDYSDGNVFFMYTPFQGQMLQEVLSLLNKESRRRIIRIYTYGPCSQQVATQNWLKCTNGQGNDIYKLYEFVSV
jgi:hypothetical protein